MQENETSVSTPESQPAAGEQAVKPQHRAGLWSAISWVRDLAFSILIAVVLIVFIYQPVKVEGTSMLPTLSDQERIFINKFTYRFGLEDIRRGDTVVFWWPLDPTKSYIKRVIGLPGDTVRIDDGQVYINGVHEDFVPAQFRDHSSWGPRVVPPNDYFVLGDHRSSSSDSRTWDWVPRRNIYGKAVFVYWPLDKMGRVQ